MSVSAISAATPAHGGFGVLTPEQFSDFLEENFKRANARELAAPSQGLAFYNVQDTSKDHERHTYVTGFRLMPQSRDASHVPLGEVVQGFDNTYTPVDYRLGYAFEDRLRETGLYSLITKIQRGMMKSAMYTIEYLAADPFNRGFGASTAPWLCADGYFLFDSSRPNEAGEGTWSNLETASALTQDAWETMKVNARKAKNERGLVSPVHLKTLIVPPALERKALELQLSTQSPEDALNAANVYQNKFSVACWDYLTSDTAWFGMADASDVENELFWYWRIRPNVKTYDNGNPDVEYQRVKFSAVTGADRPVSIRGNAGA